MDGGWIDDGRMHAGGTHAHVCINSYRGWACDLARGCEVATWKSYLSALSGCPETLQYRR